VAAPLKKDQELDLKIDSLAYGGNGVARLNGFVVFVRRGLPGDTVRARVTKVKRNHAEATALEVVDAGAPRVDAPCAHYPACGGCRFQDLAYEAQTAAKEAQVADALARIGRLEGFKLDPILPASPSSTIATSSSTPSRRRTESSARIPPGRPLGRGARHRALLAHDRPRQRDTQPRQAMGQ
jgi:tRNA/tmRNA/rRNA uracil-C5-methylase (TrmA/RlmC/RlmD family)